MNNKKEHATLSPEQAERATRLLALKIAQEYSPTQARTIELLSETVREIFQEDGIDAEESIAEVVGVFKEVSKELDQYEND